MTLPLNSRPKINSDVLAAIGVSLAPIAYFLPAIVHGLVLAPDDGILQNVPFRVAAAQIVRSGYLPLWNPYLFGGMPLMAAAQGGVLFPLNWFYLISSAATATNLMVVSTFMLAGLGAFLFARRTGASLGGAIVTSLIWQAGGFLINQISHINIVQTAALLPWVLWAMERYVETGSRRRGAIVALLVAAQIFAGHQQTFAYAYLLVIAYGLVMAFATVAQRKRYISSLVFTVVGVWLAAVQILPTWELLRNSPRANASYDFFSSFSMQKKFVATFLAPYIMGGGDGRLFRAPYIGQSFYTEYVPYAGVLAIMLVLIALALRPDRRAKFWAITVVVGLLLAFGLNSPLHLYRLIYLVPVLNLFRVPARHLLEVHFAVAMLAGQGFTRLSMLKNEQRLKRRVLVISGLVFVLTCLVVTLLRPSDFRLGREAPMSVMRAPELFMPIVFATLSVLVLWRLIKDKPASHFSLIVILAIDLFLWGQFSGWYASSRRIPAELWSVPESVKLLREKTEGVASSYRILTTHLPFEPSVSLSNARPGWVLWTEPDIYMMYGIQNAAGYDGFGLQRYSELAGQMKLWGELTDANATLRSNSREIDILNTRYVIARHERPIEKREHDSAEVAVPTSLFPTPEEKFGEFKFAQNNLSLPNIGLAKRISFQVPPVESDHIALLTNLSFAEDVPDNSVVAHLKLTTTDGRELDFPIRAGVDTADWAYDRPDIKNHIRHKQATVATSYDVSDSQNNYKGHTYVTSFQFPERVAIDHGELSLEPQTQWPGVLLSLFRLSLADSFQQKDYPLTRDMIVVENIGGSSSKSDPDARWKFVARGLDVNIYENKRALPRAWLASDYWVLDDQATLQVVRTGRLADGTSWDSLHTALVAVQPQNFSKNASQNGRVDVTDVGPNRIRVKTNAEAASILVLSENDYPGWRAYIDDQPTTILQVNYAQRGVVVAAGEHEVSFVYRPWSVMGGLLISIAALAGLVIFERVGKRVEK